MRARIWKIRTLALAGVFTTGLLFHPAQFSGSANVEAASTPEAKILFDGDKLGDFTLYTQLAADGWAAVTDICLDVELDDGDASGGLYYGNPATCSYVGTVSGTALTTPIDLREFTAPVTMTLWYALETDDTGSDFLKISARPGVENAEFGLLASNDPKDLNDSVRRLTDTGQLVAEPFVLPKNSAGNLVTFAFEFENNPSSDDGQGFALLRIEITGASGNTAAILLASFDEFDDDDSGELSLAESGASTTRFNAWDTSNNDGLSKAELRIAADTGDSAKKEGGSNGPCFIATAAYGTPMATEIDTLRAARDVYLLDNAAGVAFVDTYYRMSPAIASVVAAHPVLGAAVRTALVPMVWFAGLLASAPGVVGALLLAAGAGVAYRVRRGLLS